MGRTHLQHTKRHGMMVSNKNVGSGGEMKCSRVAWDVTYVHPALFS